MIVAPGGAGWLLRHEIRIGWRNVGGKRVWLLLIGGGVLWAFVHVAAWLLLRGLSSEKQERPNHVQYSPRSH